MVLDSRVSPSSEALTCGGLSLNSVAMTSSDFDSCGTSIASVVVVRSLNASMTS